ncbi:hypothetical protein, partial [Escherichia coli]
IKNDGHYFCRAGGNRPDGLNEPVTFFTPNGYFFAIRGPLGKGKFSHAKRIELNEWLHPGQLTH